MKATEDQSFWSRWTVVVGALGTWIVICTLWFTRHATRAAVDGARAADLAARASIQSVSDAREAFQREFRPWVTADATLDSEVGKKWAVDPDEVAFFIKLTSVNVGKTAARDIAYHVRAIDNGNILTLQQRLEALIKEAVDAMKTSGTSLVPSETHTTRSYLRVPLDRPELPVPRNERIFTLCIVAVITYRGDPSDERVFCTAKVWPLGRSNLIEFLHFIDLKELPLDTDVLALGPSFLAETT